MAAHCIAPSRNPGAACGTGREGGQDAVLIGFSDLVAIGAAGLAAWTSLRVKALEAERAAEQRRFEAEREARRFREPLARAAYDLQSRLWNILARDFLDAYLVHGTARTRAYAVSNTVFLIAQFQAWMELARRELHFVDLGKDSATRRLAAAQNRIIDLWGSDSAALGSARLRIFAGEQRAIGERMVLRETVPPSCLGYGAFLREVQPAGDPLIDALTEEVRGLPEALDAARPRLIALQHALIDLVDLLDPKGLRFPAASRSRYGAPPG